MANNTNINGDREFVQLIAESAISTNTAWFSGAHFSNRSPADLMPIVNMSTCSAASHCLSRWISLPLWGQFHLTSLAAESCFEEVWPFSWELYHAFFQGYVQPVVFLP